MVVHVLDKSMKDFHLILKKINKISHNEGYHFSKSHCGNVLVVAECLNSKIGIDIEKNKYRSLETITFFLHKYSSIKIINNIYSLQTGFYMAWTAMESYFKILGKGFYADKHFTIDLKNKIIISTDKCFYFDYIDFGDYIICICVNNKKNLFNVSVDDNYFLKNSKDQVI